MENVNDYDWNIEIDVGGVTFHGPGMDTEGEAQAVATMVEQAEDVDVRVIEQ